MGQALERQTAEEAQGGHSGPVIDTAGGFGIIDCAACGYAHVLPLPEPEEVEALYTEAYYTREKPKYLAHAREDAEWLELGFRDRLRIFEATLPGSVFIGKRARLLDVGSGPGHFLKAANESGFEVVGIEPSRQAAEHARAMGLEIHQAFFGPGIEEGLGRFDAIHMNNVLEHVPNPAALLATAQAMLEPGGVLCVSVPNDYNPLQETARFGGLDPWWLAPPHHLNYFNFDTLSKLIVRADFDIVERFTSFPMELFLLQGEKYVGNAKLGRACHGKRKAVDLALETAGQGAVRRAFYAALAEAGLGREAILFAQKPLEARG